MPIYVCVVSRAELLRVSRARSGLWLGEGDERERWGVGRMVEKGTCGED